LIDTFEPLDDFLLKPVDGLALLPCPDMSITLNLTMDTLSDDINYAFFNNITYSRPLVPTLYTALTTGSLATNPTVYGVNTNPFVLPHNKVIEIIVNNHDPGKHPFHLHGHNFQVTHRSKENAGSFNPVTADKPPLVPMRRDVVLAPPSGNVVLRFFADNPGVWLFHCHIEWHLISVCASLPIFLFLPLLIGILYQGLVATMIEAPLELQGHITIPPDHLAVCKYKGIPIEGDSMGNPIEGDSIGNTNGLLGLPGPDVSPKQPPAEPAVFPHIMELGAKVIELTQLMKELLGMYGVNFNPSTWQLS
jgi:iron transport multicopper oxidase